MKTSCVRRAPGCCVAAPGAAHPWLDVAARQSERSRAGGLLESLSVAIAQRDERAFAELRPELPALNQIGSLLWAAELQLLSGRRHLAMGGARTGSTR